MKNATAVTKTIEVEFEVESAIVISDPCYLERADEDGFGTLTWGDGMHKREDVKRGTWTASIELADNSQTSGWGERVAKLTAEFDSSHKTAVEQIGYAAVDSGQMFIGAVEGLPIDYEALLALYYDGPKIDGAQNSPGPASPTGREWVNHQMLACQTGAVSSTGYGDGSYPVFVTRDSEGLINGIVVDFMIEEDEEDEDYCMSCGGHTYGNGDYCTNCDDPDDEDDDE